MAAPVAVGVLTNAGAAHLDLYFAALAQSEEAKTVALADPSGQSVPSARKILGEKLTAVFPTAAELLSQRKPTLALVSLEAASAPPVIEAALQAGCHVYAEKPACVREADFARLVRLADSKHLLLMLALANRLHPAMREARRLIRANRIGKIFGLEMHLVADQTRLTRPAYHQTWFAQKDRAGGGHLIWLGIHWLDLAMYLTGSKITEVAGFTANVGGQPLDVEDSAAMALRFENGTLGTLTSGYYLDRGYHSHIKIWGSKGWLQLGLHGGEPLIWAEHGQPDVQRYTGPTEPSGYTPFVAACLRAALGQAEPPITNAESLQVIQTVFACYRAAETGQAQRVD